MYLPIYRWTSHSAAIFGFDRVSIATEQGFKELNSSRHIDLSTWLAERPNGHTQSLAEHLADPRNPRVHRFYQQLHNRPIYVWTQRARLKRRFPRAPRTYPHATSNLHSTILSKACKRSPNLYLLHSIIHESHTLAWHHLHTLCPGSIQTDARADVVSFLPRIGSQGNGSTM